ncbi:MAG: hypothetical protein IKB82_00455 [Clostridia bacterium]|nr:hypothetical protein [Clostridia bacterium]
MSSKDMARRATAEFVFAGADITSSVRPYFLSVTYTDNEEDETDDLQIKLHDREDIWLAKWLTDIIDAASSAAPSPGPTGGGASLAVGDVVEFIGSRHYTSSSGDKGYNARPGPANITHSAPGSKHPWHLIHTDKTSNVYGWVNESDIKGASAAAAPAPSTGFKIQATFVRQNWKGDGKDTVLDCGQFEVDDVDVSGPPNIITIKATSLPYMAQIRQTKKTKAWEAYSLSGIANSMASANGMTCMYLSATDPKYDRVEQYKTSDIEFLSWLCHNAGISLKVTNNIIVLFDQADYEKKESVRTIRRGDGSYLKSKLHVGAADSEYASCRVSYTDPATGRCIEGTAKVEDYDAKSKNNQQLEIKAKVANAAEAKTLAEKHLRLHNKYAKTATFTMPGDHALVAGVTVMLSGWGTWDGKYIVKQAKHTIGTGGYTVQIKLRKVLEGY